MSAYQSPWEEFEPGCTPWQGWFAWRPTIVRRGEVKYLVWLERIQRRRCYSNRDGSFEWEYKVPD